jgi:hypothetical protein
VVVSAKAVSAEEPDAMANKESEAMRSLRMKLKMK